MKICPQCRTLFQDELNYCLEDGATLVTLDAHDPDKTLEFNEAATKPKNVAETGKQNHQTVPQNYPIVGAPKKNFNPLLGVLIILFVVSGLIASVFGGVYYLRKNTRADVPTSTPRNGVTPFSPTPASSPKISIPQPAKLEVNCGDEKIKGSFGSQYLKCNVKNISDGIVSDPSVSINLYKGDVKTKSLYGRTDLKFLKPQQMIPIWVDLMGAGEYTSLKAEPGFTSRTTDKSEENLFPNLAYSDTKMTSKKGTSLYNFKPYTEIFYTVSGVVVNNDFDKISPSVYVFFYNDSKEIVGIGYASVSNLKKGEKGMFEVSKGDTQLFGTPKTFEIFSINN